MVESKRIGLLLQLLLSLLQRLLLLGLAELPGSPLEVASQRYVSYGCC